MWLPTPPDRSETLRQGDLLVDLCLPKLSWPLAYARPPGQPVAEKNPIVIPASRPDKYVVVSQCCTIEQRGAIALARVSKVRPHTEEELDALMLDEPTGDPGDRYSANAHLLRPVNGYIEEWSIGMYPIIDLTTIQTYFGATAEFQDKRVAAMTPQGRRLLRLRLQYFWGRVEREDELWFESQGLPAGVRRSQVPTAETASLPANDGRTSSLADEASDGDAPGLPTSSA